MAENKLDVLKYFILGCNTTIFRYWGSTKSIYTIENLIRLIIIEVNHLRNSKGYN